MDAADPTAAGPRVVVHLVHGTWPFGLGRSRSGARQAWFEPGSAVRQRLTGEGPDVAVRAFAWSGRNSPDARGIAAREFLGHLEAALDEHPQARHVVVAHSHGGTVAAHALSAAPIPPQATPKIKALICMATPFAFVRDADRKVDLAVRLALSAAGVALAWMVVIAVDAVPAGYGSLWALTLPFLAPVLAALVEMFTGGGPYSKAYRGAAVPHRIPTFVMRATRDEAALVLGVCQWAQSVGWAIFDLLDEPLKSRRRFILGLVASPIVVALALALLAGVVWVSGHRLPNLTATAVSVILLCGLVTVLPIVAARLVMALGVGDWRIRDWPGTFVEVDAAPPDTPCQFKVYSELKDAPEQALRHGIYELPALQTEVRRLITAVAERRQPRLLQPAELEHEAAAVDPTVLASLQFVQKQDLRWVEAPPGGPGVAIVDWSQPQPGGVIAELNVGEWIATTRGRRTD